MNLEEVDARARKQRERIAEALGLPAFGRSDAESPETGGARLPGSVSPSEGEGHGTVLGDSLPALEGNQAR